MGSRLRLADTIEPLKVHTSNLETMEFDFEERNVIKLKVDKEHFPCTKIKDIKDMENWLDLTVTADETSGTIKIDTNQSREKSFNSKY